MTDIQGLDLERLKRLNISPEDYIKARSWPTSARNAFRKSAIRRRISSSSG